MLTRSELRILYAAAALGQAHLWAMGDAMVRILGRKAVEEQFYEISKALTERFENKTYSTSHLRKLYRVALAFPKKDRIREVSWAAHCAAGTPATLKQVLKDVRPRDLTAAIVHDFTEQKRKRNPHQRRRFKYHQALRIARGKAALLLAKKNIEMALNHLGPIRDYIDPEDQADIIHKINACAEATQEVFSVVRATRK